MLLDGVNHVAILTNDSDRLHAFYADVFEAHVSRGTTEARSATVLRGHRAHDPAERLPGEGNREATRQTPMFGRGRIDHLGLQAASKEAFDRIRERLITCGASGRFRHRLRAPS